MKRWKIRPIPLLLNLVLVIFALGLLFPLFWMVIASFMTDFEVTKTPPTLWPSTFFIGNYKELFTTAPALRWFANSVFVSTVTSVLVIIISAMAGYAFAKKKFFLKNVLFSMLVATIMVPRQILIVPLISLVKALHLSDSYWGLIVPALGWPIGVFLMKQFMVTLPSEMIEAARIDGSGELHTFWHIILPLAKPGLGALAIFTFISSWNDYMWQLLVISTKLLKTLPLGVATLQEEFSVRYGLQMAGAVVASLPMVVVFLLFQRYFTKGITLGAVKG